MTATHTKLTNDQLDELRNGETVLDNGLIVRFRMEPDYDTRVNDFDCYGRIEPAIRHPYNGRYRDRPDGFDGCAELLSVGRSNDTWWWQPPVFSKADRRLWHTDSKYRAELRQQVSDVLNYGFYEYWVEIYKTCEACNTEHRIADAICGGYEPFMDDESVMSALSDLFMDASYNLDA